MKIHSLSLYALAFCLIALLAGPAHAEIIIGATRAIYPAQSREITLRLSNNEASEARLVQAWIDDGDADTAPESMDVPFALTPPIFRLDAGKSQILRIAYAPDEGNVVSGDKESLYWINVRAMPPKSEDAASKNALRFALRTRIKLFFRPTNLAGYAADAAEKLQWKLMANETGHALEVHNPSAYHVSFAGIAVGVDGQEINTESLSMVAPGDTGRIMLKGLPSQQHGKAELRFQIIDDNGNIQVHTAVL
ncbi:molecular chaperone [Collimonas sp. NPDC087041]|uniref:fimbrial biogenesis chaperone n=1 Tax=Collimonas sp. NPDC087041 TaxID=3363960 RepID=UPI003820296D